MEKWSGIMNSKVAKEKIQKASKHLKICSTFLLSRKMQPTETLPSIHQFDHLKDTQGVGE